MKFTKSIFWLFVVISIVGCGDSKPTKDNEFLKAIRQNNTEKIAQLLHQNQQLLHQSVEADSLTPLHFACKKSKPETVKLLIQKGAKINQTCKNGNTPLHYSAENLMNNVGVMRVLLEEGADVSIKNLQEKDVWTNVLNSKKGNLFKKDCELLELLMRFNYLPDTTSNADQKNILHELSERCESPEITEFLVEKYKMNPNSIDVNGWTPLHYASKGKNYEVARILIKNGANVNAQTTRFVGTSQKSRWSCPKGSTPWDVYMKQSHTKTSKNMSPLFEKNGGKRQADLSPNS